MSNDLARRDFLKTTAGVLAGGAVVGQAWAAGSDTIKVGVIGCGGRGSGAAENVLQAAKGVEIVAVGDYFENKARNLGKNLAGFVERDARCKEMGNKVDLPPERCYGGLDAYERVINTPGVNYVILATSPGFRPMHLEAAVAAGKNIFTEKPVAVDGQGLTRCFKVAEEARKKGLAVGAGTQRRHQKGYIDTIKRIQDGEIGDIVSARAYWNNANFIWFRKREAGMTDLDYQVHNWYHFLWLCGDHIVEQHVHNLDVVNWATGKMPVKALGMGGRIMPCKDPNVDGNIYNFFACDFEYDGGLHVLSTCRQLKGADSNISEALVGTKGSCQVNDYRINGQVVFSKAEERKLPSPYVQEHTDLIESIRNGKPLNELKGVTESTATAILGRTAAYLGRIVTMKEVLEDKVSTMPTKLSRDMSLPVGPVPVPGVQS